MFKIGNLFVKKHFLAFFPQGRFMVYGVQICFWKITLDGVKEGQKQGSDRTCEAVMGGR